MIGEKLFYIGYTFCLGKSKQRGQPPYHFSLLFILPTYSHITPLLLYIFYSLYMGKFAVSIGIASFRLLYTAFVSLLIWYFSLICMVLSNYFSLSEKYF